MKLIDRIKNTIPLDFPMNWIVQYSDGSILKEYNDDETLNSFQDIQKNEVEWFGLFGNGIAIKINKAQGKMYINNREVAVIYQTENERKLISNSPNKKDIIIYKTASSFYSEVTKEEYSTLDAVTIGYKSKIQIEGQPSYIQFEIIVPSEGELALKTRITTPESKEGQLLFLVDGEVVEEFSAPLIGEYAGEMIWTIKI